jgi:preprotein translocase subunit SecG
MLGLIQTRFTPTQIAEMLQVGVSEWFYQPNLLRERLADFSFNWILENRVLPFGTFINGIDYALFLAAMLGLGVAWWLETLTADRRPPTAASSLSTDAHSVGITYHVSRIAYHTFWLIGSLAHWFIGSLAHWLIPTICLALISIALLLTYKGSGLLALAGAGAVLVWKVGATRTTASRLLPPAYWLLGVVLLLGIIFFEPIVQRGAFLLQREMGNSYETGTFGNLESSPCRTCRNVHSLDLG